MQLLGVRGQAPPTLGARDFSGAVSGFGQVLKSEPKTCRPAADVAPPHTREKISGTHGRLSQESFWIFNSLKSPFLGFRVIQKVYWPDLNLECVFHC